MSSNVVTLTSVIDAEPFLPGFHVSPLITGDVTVIGMVPPVNSRYTDAIERFVIEQGGVMFVVPETLLERSIALSSAPFCTQIARL